MSCSNGYLQRYVPKTASQCANYIEYVELFSLITNVYLRYKAPTLRLGKNVEQFLKRNFHIYEDMKDNL